MDYHKEIIKPKLTQTDELESNIKKNICKVYDVPEEELKKLESGKKMPKALFE